MLNKTCTKCKHVKELNAFAKNQKWCRACKKEYRALNIEQEKACKAAYQAKNKVQIAARKRLYYEANKKAILTRCKEYYRANKKDVLQNCKKYYQAHKTAVLTRNKVWHQANPKKLLSYKKRYKQRNPDKVTAMTAKRRAQKLQATPKWLTKQDLKQLAEWYKIAKDLQWLSEERLHVDHIVPLQGEDVCGLHVPWNLQVLPASVNLRKSNMVKCNDVSLINRAERE